MITQHDTTIRVRYSETDQMGFLHHSNYLTYFEIARTELFRANGGNYRRVEEEGMFVVVAKVECNYHRPARYDDVLNVRARLVETTHAKIKHEYEVSRDGDRLASAKITLAVVNRAGEVQRVPEMLRLTG